MSNMTRNRIRQKIVSILFDELKIDGFTPESINDGVHITNDLGADSLEMATLALAIEHEFGVALEARDFAAVARLGDLVDTIEKQLPKIV